MAKRSRRSCCLYILAVIFLFTAYFTGIVEYMLATSTDKFTWPLEVDTDKLIEDYRTNSVKIEPVNKRNFHLKIIPDEGCKVFKTITVLIKTKAEDLYNREVLRRTWTQALLKQDHRYAFLVGNCPPADDTECEDSIELESKTHFDMLQGDFLDSYRNNTQKTMMALRYVTEYCIPNQATSYTLLIDGDYALNVYNLEDYIKKTNKKSDLYAGATWWHSRVFRLPLHKHYVSLSEFQFSHYPPFVSAGAILFSADMVEKFYIISQYTRYYPFDDIFFGIVAKKLGVIPTDMADLIPSYFNIPEARDDRNKFLVGSHRVGVITEIDHIYREYGQQAYSNLE